MSDVPMELQKALDDRYDVGVELLKYMRAALNVYSDKPKINIPHCSQEHLTHIIKELSEYIEEVHRIRCNLPRLLENRDGFSTD